MKNMPLMFFELPEKCQVITLNVQCNDGVNQVYLEKYITDNDIIKK